MRIQSRSGLRLTNSQIASMNETELAMYILIFHERLEKKASDRLFEISGKRILGDIK